MHARGSSHTCASSCLEIRRRRFSIQPRATAEPHLEDRRHLQIEVSARCLGWRELGRLPRRKIQGAGRWWRSDFAVQRIATATSCWADAAPKARVCKAHLEVPAGRATGSNQFVRPSDRPHGLEHGAWLCTGRQEASQASLVRTPPSRISSSTPRPHDPTTAAAQARWLCAVTIGDPTTVSGGRRPRQGPQSSPRRAENTGNALDGSYSP